MGFPSFARHPSQLSSPYALPAALRQPASEGTDSRIDVDYAGRKQCMTRRPCPASIPKKESPTRSSAMWRRTFQMRYLRSHGEQGAAKAARTGPDNRGPGGCVWEPAWPIGQETFSAKYLRLANLVAKTARKIPLHFSMPWNLYQVSVGLLLRASGQSHPVPLRWCHWRLRHVRSVCS